MPVVDPHFCEEDREFLQMEMKACLNEMQELEKLIREAKREGDQERITDFQERFNRASEQYDIARTECVDKYGPKGVTEKISKEEPKPFLLVSERKKNSLSL